MNNHNTVWEKDVQLPQFPQLEEDLQTDVLIIGGGMAGLLCAKRLSEAGVNCTLIEQKRIMSGVSGRTTAKITAQHGLIYDKLLKRLGDEQARMYWQANADALASFRELAEGIDCDFLPQNCYLYATGNVDLLESEMAACEQLRIPAQWENKLPLPFSVTGSLCMPNQGQFHPLKFSAHLCAGLRIYENTKALSFQGNTVITPKGRIFAERIIVTTHFPMLNKHGAYYLKLYQQRSYVTALENAGKVDGMYLDCEENGLSVRRAGEWLLLGGGGHRTGKGGNGWKLPDAVAETFYPQAKIVARWATQDCMTLDGMPYIGQYSKQTPDLYVATGFQKWGMSTSMVAAQILTALVQGWENPYGTLFSPNRSVWHKQLLINGLDATVNLLRPTKPRCPHLGCALRWNAVEHSWDCPCHGSRFDESGKVLNNPATDDMRD